MGFIIINSNFFPTFSFYKFKYYKHFSFFIKIILKCILILRIDQSFISISYHIRNIYFHSFHYKISWNIMKINKTRYMSNPNLEIIFFNSINNMILFKIHSSISNFITFEYKIWKYVSFLIDKICHTTQLLILFRCCNIILHSSRFISHWTITIFNSKFI